MGDERDERCPECWSSLSDDDSHCIHGRRYQFAPQDGYPTTLKEAEEWAKKRSNGEA